MTERWLTLPNAITLFRLFLVPVFLALFLLHQPEWALATFGFAAFSDILDGFAARVLNQRSKLGGILDPIADKLLAFTALVALSSQHRIPWWLFGVVLVRDGLIVVGALVVRLKHLEIPTAPSRVGKYATFMLTCLVLLALADQSSYAPHSLRAYTVAVGFIAGLCVVVSTIQYFARFGYLWFAPPRLPFKNPDHPLKV